jgi:hypothetical protein
MKAFLNTGSNTDGIFCTFKESINVVPISDILQIWRGNPNYSLDDANSAIGFSLIGISVRPVDLMVKGRSRSNADHPKNWQFLGQDPSGG